MLQSQALDILKAGRNVYLTGSAGSGKTHTLREYIAHLRHRGVVVGMTASTGIAATHLGGVTIHSWSGIGIKEWLSDQDIDLLVQKEYLWKRFDTTKVLIIDEVSMLSPDFFDSLDRLCRTMKQTSTPFGGMQIVLSGDFFQLPPIVRGSSRIEFISASNAWRVGDFRTCYLEEQHRQKDESLERILNEMREGNVSEKARKLLMSRRNAVHSDGIAPTRLYTHNKDVDAQNEQELEKLPGKEYEYEMQTHGKANVVQSLVKGILAPEHLKLKKDAVVMFVKNNFEAGYVNGTLGVVEGFENNLTLVRTFSGDSIEVYPEEWTVEENDKVIAKAEQLPLRLALAITVHKNQSMNFDAALIDLSQSFVPGQGYVALSRLRTLEGLVLRGLNDMALAVNRDVLHLDQRLRAESCKWEKVIVRFGREEMEQMHCTFIEKCGGTNDEKEIIKNKERGAEELTKKVPTVEQTRALVEQGLSLEEIAKGRGMTVTTIVSHLEKLQKLCSAIDLSRFKPKVIDLKKIQKAFVATKGEKLAPVHRKLKGAYTYEELRVARLFF